MQISRNRSRAISLLNWLCAAVALNALFGLFVQFSGADTVFWFEIRTPDRVTGTFVNRNSFATYLGLALVCTTGLIWQRVTSITRGVDSPAERRRLLAAHALEGNWPLLAAWFVLMVALFLTESRAGTTASLLALLCLVLSLGLRSARFSRSIVIPAVLILVAIFYVFRLSGAGLDARLQQTELSWPARLHIYETTWLAVDDASLTGTGAGTFESVFRFYGADASGKVVAQAHSDYLELALELGLPAAAAWVAALLAIGLICAAGVFRRYRDYAFPCIGLSASVLIGLHSAIDFSLQIPAVAAAFCIIFGISAAQSSSSRR